MASHLEFRPLHPLFVAEAQGVDLQRISDSATLQRLRSAMDEFAVLVFRGQRFGDTAQLEFARRFDGELHAKTGVSALAPNRFGDEALTDVSNINAEGAVLPADDRRRQYGLANRLWHTDASFESPRGRYSMLSARHVPQAGIANTEFADMRAAFDALPPAEQARLSPLRAHHSIAYSRQVLGFEFSAEEAGRLEGTEQPLINENPNTGRRSLYLASHASRIIGWSVPDGRLLLADLIEHATQREFVYAHEWHAEDFVIWDNRATMHRARPFDDTQLRRDMRRVTTLDL